MVIKNIRSAYLICFFLALALNIIFTFIRFRKKIDIFVILGFLFYENVGFILGAKVFSFIVSYPEYKSIAQAGLSAYGALIGGFLTTVVFCLEFKLPLLKFIENYAIFLPLIYAVGKVGCFFAGCCYGITWDNMFSVTYVDSLTAPNGVMLFPVQLVEAILNLIIFLYVFFANKNSYKKVGLTFILCSISKFLLDFLRASWVGNVSANQWVSIALFIIGIHILHRGEKVNDNEVSKVF